jgi:RHS repeat-associated protein
MKKIIIPIGLLLTTHSTYAQLTPLPNTENYVQTKTYLDYNGTTPTKSSETVQYFDGLGRPKQVVNVKASPLGKDVVTHIEYDAFGRQTKDYLPIPQSGTLNGAIVPTPLANAPSVYGSEKIYAEKILENSPLDRIQQQIQVGNDWTNKPVAFQYGTNTQNEVYKFTTNTTWVNNATSSALVLEYFPPNQLYKNTVTDEDGNVTIEFKNGQGQVILIRKNDGTYYTDTYYVYNEYNQLAFVIPPKAIAGPITEAVLNDLCYQYRYDGRGRLVEKKLPSKGWEYMVYNKADKLIMSQDANLKAQNKWMLTKYDQFGRVAYTGISITSLTRQALQTNANTSANVYESRSTTTFTMNGMPIYYSNVATPVNVERVLTINYYDSYPGYSFNPSFPPTIQGEPILTETPSTDGRSIKGLPVMSLVKNIEDDNWTKNYTYYDTKGRSIGNHSINHLGGYTRTESKLDFAGIPQTVITRHKRLNTDTERVITENFTYDNQNRLLVHKHQVDSNPEEILAQNKYNELSQLENKKVGGTNTASPLQSIDYNYNIRGWMTKINDPASLGSKLFGYQIKYNNPDPLLGIQEAKYNGNISEVDWKIATDGILKRYTYKYDALNRLKYGKSYQPLSTTLNIDYYENVEYDNNGNITALARGKKGLGSTSITEMIDNLTYNYEGNKLVTVTDSTGNVDGYRGGGNMITYDLNGNMISMVDKRIKQIDYNFLNLPNSIQMNAAIGAGYTLTHIYRADGTKLTKQYKKLSTVINTDYLDGFQYEYISMLPTASDLKFVPTSEGFYSFENNKYIYQYKDQVGNIRVSFYKDTNGNAIIDDAVDFYPFGFEHGTIATSIVTPSYKYSFQSQEKQIHTGWNSFKWRNYDPSIGRFFNVDPLAESFLYNSTYAFAENRVIDGRELEGLEWVPIKDDKGALTTRQLNVSITNNAKLNEKQLSKVTESFKSDFAKKFSTEGVKAELVVSDKATIKVNLVDQTSTTITDSDGNEFSKFKGGVTATLGESQENSFSVTATVDGNKRDNSDITRSFNHEAAHTAGLDHPWGKSAVSDMNQSSKDVKSSDVKKNLLNSGANPIENLRTGAGSKLTQGQVNSMDKLIEQQQPKK